MNMRVRLVGFTVSCLAVTLVGSEGFNPRPPNVPLSAVLVDKTVDGEIQNLFVHSVDEEGFVCDIAAEMRPVLKELNRALFLRIRAVVGTVDIKWRVALHFRVGNPAAAERLPNVAFGVFA